MLVGVWKDSLIARIEEANGGYHRGSHKDRHESRTGGGTCNGNAPWIAGYCYTMERTTPPSTRSAAPLVAEARGLHT